MQKNIPDAIAACSKALINLALKIHKTPELGFEEYKACSWQTRLLKRWGFEVTTPFSGMKTAYFVKKGEGSKVKLVRRNAFKDIDAVIMAHPASRTAIWNGCLAVKRYDISFHGKSSHASESPEKGKNALDAVMLMFQGVNAWRQHLPETCRIHGIVINGGRASTDFGDVSQVVPGTHVYFGISQKRIPLHSAKFAKAASTKYALQQMLKAAEAMAWVGYRFFNDEKFRRKVKNSSR